MAASRTLHRMFVYGTLKRGQPNHPRLLDSRNGVAKLLGEAKLVNNYPLVVATRHNIPFLLDREGEGKEVHGDLFAVNDRMLGVLDDLERHPYFYKRSKVSCVLKQAADSAEYVNGDVINCEVYLMFNFRPDLLTLPQLSSYADDPQRPYVYVKDRGDPNVHDWWSEVKADYIPKVK